MIAAHRRLAVAGFLPAALLLGTLGAPAASSEPAAPTGAPDPSLPAPPPSLERLPYNNPGLTVDLGVGLWAYPLPMDVDGDGVNDLLVNSPDTPFNGVWYFQNTGTNDDPLFAEPVRLSQGEQDTHISHVDGEVYVTTPGTVYPDVRTSGLTRGEEIPFDGTVHEPLVPGGDLRGDQWQLVDYTGDGELDVVVGIGDWSEYGWDDAWNEDGEWTAGPLHGFVYLLENLGTTDEPDYADPVRIEAAGEPIDVFGAPTPVVQDFTGDGDLDIITGEFLDTPQFFENVGTRTEPEYAAGREIPLDGGGHLTMDVQMIVVTEIDWDVDGHHDLVIGEEDGRVALVRNTGETADGVPVFEPPEYFQQQAEYVKVGALSTPTAADWNGDGREDLIVGDTAGRLSFVENLGGDSATPRWAAPVHLEADGEVIRHQAGYNGSIQGPAEAKWGYTAPVTTDWNHDGLVDILVNDIWGKVVWYENIGTPTAPRLAAAQPIEVNWESPPPKPEWNWWNPDGDELVTQWRTTPFAMDADEDGLTDLVLLDHEGYLSYFKRVRTDDGLELLPGERIFSGVEDSSTFDRNGVPRDGEAGPLRLNDETAGGSGRRKFTIVDWTGDGRLDIIGNGDVNVRLLENVGTDDAPWVFDDRGAVTDGELVGHTTAPTVVNWDDDTPDLLIGGEDGHFYYQPWNRGQQPPERRPEPIGELADVVGTWSFDEVAGHVAHDESGYGNHGVVDGAARVDGYAGSALDFDRFNDHVDLSHTVGAHLDAANGLSFAAWVRQDSLEDSQQRLFGTRINGGTAGFEVTTRHENGAPRIAVAGRSRSSDGYRSVVFDATGLRADTWHHVAAVLDFAADDVRLYVDGRERQVVDGSDHRFASRTYQLGRPAEPDALGRSPNGTAYFGGTLDEVQVRRAAATPAEIALMILDPMLRRHVDDGAVRRQVAHPLRRHLDLAVHRHDHGDTAGAAEAMGRFAHVVDGHRGRRWIDDDVRGRLLRHAEAYLDAG